MTFKPFCGKMLKASSLFIFFFVSTFLIPFVASAQPGGPGDGGGGTGPDEAVPFDDNMNLAFLTAGVFFAGFIAYKQMRKKTIAQ